MDRISLLTLQPPSGAPSLALLHVRMCQELAGCTSSEDRPDQAWHLALGLPAFRLWEVSFCCSGPQAVDLSYSGAHGLQHSYKRTTQYLRFCDLLRPHRITAAGFIQGGTDFF